MGALGPRAKRAVPALEVVLGKEKQDYRIRHAASLALWKVDRSAYTRVLQKKERTSRVRFNLLWARSSIGQEAKELAPIVLKIASDPNDDHEPAVLALRHIGADPAKAIPVLVEALGDDLGQYKRTMAAQGLGAMGAKAKPALPALYRALDDPNGAVRVDAATAVWKIEKAAKKVLPVLIAGLDDIDGAARQRATYCCKAMGPAAKEAFEPLLKLWKKHHGKETAGALKAIDPKRAVKEGVR
jgi:HEAT repeat protein